MFKDEVLEEKCCTICVEKSGRSKAKKRRRRQENNNANNRNPNESGANDNRANGLDRFQPNQNLTAQQIMENARKEFQYTRAYDRYLTDMGWKNQCVVISVDQVCPPFFFFCTFSIELWQLKVMDIDESNEECRFKSTKVTEIIKELAKRHRLFMICCLPASVVLQLYSKTANSDQQQYKEQQSVEEKAMLCQSSFEKFCLLTHFFKKKTKHFDICFDLIQAF
ncbi:hypothetical protein RFI_31536 [Reticulomyxa filosa]|uniref:Uncharacterized protein n=1 Tax=Reticulomyxa filosa TaxID=46433 RepID=X6LW83_RETFI|nr:hypothetical protein RFI_31536 [Reticulomyxa filosa]|eukprot:ETO05859.1 hypothetical protein RFI_31536 [Reticulomyxa filosa]